MSLRHGILGLLNYYDMSGYDLMKLFESSLSYFWHVRTSQIYLELNKMTEDGLVISKTYVQDSRPNKKIFTITENGKNELKKWLYNFDIKKAFSIKNEFLMLNFFLGEVSKEEALKILENYKKQCESELEKLKMTEEYIGIYKGKVNNEIVPVFWELTAKHGEMMYNSCLEWIEYSKKKLEKTDF